MKVSSLSETELRSRVATTGLSLHVGPFIARVRSTSPAVSAGIGLLYHDYELDEAGDFADFHVALTQPAGLRRWYRSQVNFSFDGFMPFKPLPGDQAFAMFEWGLNWCVATYALQYLVVHAAVVERGGNALVLPAPPGSGKSTLCAALVGRGWRLLSDEMALISMHEGLVHAIPRPVSLKNQSIDIIRRFVADAVIGPAVADTTKGTVAHLKPPPESVTRADTPARARWVVFPRFQAGSATMLTPRRKAPAFMELASNAFNYDVLGAAGFDRLADLVDEVECFDFVYSDLDEAIQTFDALAADTALV